MMSNNNNKIAVKTNSLAQLKQMLEDVNLKKRMQEMLGNKAASFMTSILNTVSTNETLKKCEPRSIITASLIAATLDMPIDPNLGFAYIIPYFAKGEYKAQFQIGYKGLIQLAIRSGQYKTIHATPVYEGQIKKINPFKGEIEFNEDWQPQEGQKIVGYLAYFKLINGFEKYHYMTMEEIRKHAERYSKSYSNKEGVWTNNFNEMALKTVLKLLLKKYGLLSVEMQTVLKADQAVVEMKEDGNVEYEYIDNPDFEYQILDDEQAEKEGDSEFKQPSF